VGFIKLILGDNSMTITKKTSMVITTLGILIIFNSFGDDALSQQSRQRHQGPPPEAYTACEGKNAGDTAKFVSPRGDTVTGTCQQQGDRLVLRPDNPPDRNGTNRTNN
jgi:hypothetical protein